MNRRRRKLYYNEFAGCLHFQKRNTTTIGVTRGTTAENCLSILTLEEETPCKSWTKRKNKCHNITTNWREKINDGYY